MANSSPLAVDEQIVVSQEPLVLLLNLEGGLTPGRFEAAEGFAAVIAQAKKSYPDYDFQYVPFSFEEGRLVSLLAIGRSAKR